jgi:hypothetical protein
MNIVSESRTDRWRGSEIVAAAAKAERADGVRLASNPVVALVLAAVLGGLGACSSTLSSLPPQLGGLPADTPQQPVAPAGYPAVHDMPPPRNDVVLTDAEQKKATAELTALRLQQEKDAGVIPLPGDKTADKAADKAEKPEKTAQKADQTDQ